MRGKSGPLLVEDYRTTLALTHRFVEAAQQAGFAFTQDLNGASTRASAIRRCRATAASAARPRARSWRRRKSRPNLRVETKAFATRLLFDGKRCTGVAFRQNGQEREVRAAREVILSGGTINSPHLLQVSGIGPAAHLKSIGVDVVHDLPGVGGNLSDHYAIRVSQRVKRRLDQPAVARAAARPARSPAG